MLQMFSKLLMIMVLTVCVSGFSLKAQAQEDPNKSVAEVLNNVVKPIMAQNLDRMRLIAYVDACGEDVLLKELFAQNIIKNNIKNKIESMATQLSLTQKEQNNAQVLAAIFIEGYRQGYALAVKNILANDAERQKMCSFAINKAKEELAKNK